MDVSDTVIITADTRHTRRWSERKINPTLCKGVPAFFGNCPTTLENGVYGHTSALLVSDENVDDLETVEFPDLLGTIAADQQLTRCAQVCFASTERIKLNSTIRDRLAKSWKTKTRKEEEMPWKKLIEKLTCLNGCLYRVTQSPRKNVWHPGFVFLAELALRSDGYIETCDIHQKKHSCRCYVLLEPHKIISMPQRPFDARVATTQGQDLKHTRYHHLDLKRSITKWESMCSR